MDLWIRSQNKKTLTKVTSITLNSSSNSYVIEDEKGYMLGKYSKERALEVLDKIQSCMETNCGFDLYSRTGYYPDDFNKKWYCVPVFQMPKE